MQTQSREASSDRRGEPIRVCFTSNLFYPSFAGGALRIRRFIPRLREVGVDAFAVVGPVEGQPSREILDGFEVRRLAGPPRTARWGHGVRLFLSAFAHVLSIRDRFDLLHAVETSWLSMGAVAAAELLGKPAVIEPTLMGQDDPQTAFAQRQGPLFRSLYRRLDRVVALSSAIEQSSLDAGLSRDRVVRIPNGIDVERFRPVSDAGEKQRLRAALGLPVDAELIALVGEIQARKGVDVLLRALPEIVAARPDAHVLLVGPYDVSDTTRRFLDAEREFLTEAGLRDRLHLAGRVEEVADCLRAADVFALPTVNEGLPNSVLEAMACGLPAVVTDLPGIARDIIRNEDEGWVAAERTSAEFARAIITFLSEPARSRRVGEAARRRVCEEFSILGRARRCEALYRELLGSVAP